MTQDENIAAMVGSLHYHAKNALERFLWECFYDGAKPDSSIYDHDFVTTQKAASRLVYERLNREKK